MDVTSLLNTARRPSCCGGNVEDSSRRPDHNRSVSSPSILPGPYIEDAKESSIRYKRRNAKSWDARNVTISRVDELDSPSRRTGPPVSPRHIHRAIFEANGRPRQPSTDSLFEIISPPPIHSAKHNLYYDNGPVCSTRMPHRDHLASYPGDMPTISKHKFSISSSSFVSSESPQSECHSRLSSVASVSGISSLSIPITEMPSIDAKLFEAQSVQSSIGIAAQPLSPPLTEESSTAIQNRPRRINHFLDGSSDASLNRKGLDKPLLYWENLRPDLITRTIYHKRATSAPILASRSTKSAPNALKYRYPVPASAQVVMGPVMLKGLPTQAEEPEPTITSNYPSLDTERSALSHHAMRDGHTNAVVNYACEADLQTRDQASDPASDTVPLTQPDRIMDREVSLDALSSVSVASLEEEPRCMFVEDCQTGSQLRKAISHLFGRNKACTLRIPKQVWVYYCRKHYQRIRYRNAKTYPLNQMHLVKMQINRLQKWSNDNQRQGSGPYIKLWTLTLRKREQNRLDKEGGPADEGDDDAQETQNGSAAPEWVIQRLGTGYTTEQMLEVAERLHQEIEDGILGQVPEIEFLPDIVESGGGNIAKLVRTRKQARTITAEGEGKILKRKISVVTNSATQSSFSLFNQHETDESGSLSRKRVRLGPLQADYRQQSLQMSSLPSIVMPSADSQSAVPRTLPAVPRMQVSALDRAYGSDAYMHGLSSSRPGLPNGFYSHDSQQYGSHYQASINSVQPPPFQRDRDHHSHQRLPSISAHLSGASDFYNSNLAVPPYRTSGTFNENQSIPRPPHLRSYSANIPTAQPSLEYSRPASSNGAAQSDLAHFDSRVTSSSSHVPHAHSYVREQRAESNHSYAPDWPQNSAPQQRNYYGSSSVYDQAPHPQMNSLRTPNYLGSAPTYFDTTNHRIVSERAGHEAYRYGSAWPHADQAATKVTREVRED